MLDNEMLIMVYETLQTLSGGVKDMKSAVQALNMKLESINKRVSEMEGAVNGILNPGIMTIGAGHEAVHKKLYETGSSLKHEMTQTRETLAEELKETQDALAEELRSTQDALAKELKETQDNLSEEFKKERTNLREELASAKNGFASTISAARSSLAAEVEDIKKDHADLSARIEVYELKQQRIEAALKIKK